MLRPLLQHPGLGVSEWVQGCLHGCVPAARQPTSGMAYPVCQHLLLHGAGPSEQHPASADSDLEEVWRSREINNANSPLGIVESSLPSSPPHPPLQQDQGQGQPYGKRLAWWKAGTSQLIEKGHSPLLPPPSIVLSCIKSGSSQ